MYDFEEGSTASSCLVHDLDLVVLNGGTRVYANFGAALNGMYARQEDTVNTVEKVTIPTESLVVGSQIVVQVKTKSLSYASTQKFAVVVTGNLGGHPLPTSQPSLAPTAADTVSVSVSMQMSASQPPTESDKSNVKTSIANAVGVAESSVMGFSLTYSSSSRRHVRRKLLAYQWTAAFEIRVVLASTSFGSASGLATSVNTALTSDSFITSIGNTVGAIVDTSSLLVFVQTRHPSLSPTAAPSFSSEEEQEGNSVLGIIALAVLLVCLAGACYGCSRLCGRLCGSRRSKPAEVARRAPTANVVVYSQPPTAQVVYATSEGPRGVPGAVELPMAPVNARISDPIPMDNTQVPHTNSGQRYVRETQI